MITYDRFPWRGGGGGTPGCAPPGSFSLRDGHLAAAAGIAKCQGSQSRASIDTQYGSVYCMQSARIQHSITKELLLSDVSPEVCACVCGEGDSHRAEPRAEFPCSPPGLLFVLLIFPEENFPLASSPPPQVSPRKLGGAQVGSLSPGQLRRWDGCGSFPGESRGFAITETQIAAANR